MRSPAVEGALVVVELPLQCLALRTTNVGGLCWSECRHRRHSLPKPKKNTMVFSSSLTLPLLLNPPPRQKYFA